MAYIKVDYSDDRVAGRYKTGPILVLPQEQIYALYELDDLKCEKPLPVQNLTLTRPGEYKTVLHMFTKQDNVDLFNTLEFSTIYASPAAVNGTVWREHETTKDAQFWEDSPHWCKAIQYFYHNGLAPIEIRLEMNTTGDIVLDVDAYIEFHYLS